MNADVAYLFPDRIRTLDDTALVDAFKMACMNGTEWDNSKNIAAYRDELLRRLRQSSEPRRASAVEHT